jgi:HlyD family secretion protein
VRYIRLAVPWLVAAVAVFLLYRFVWPLFLPVEPEMDVQTTVVQRGDLRRIVPADGLLKPAVLVEVKSKAAGVVQEVLVEPGDEVEEGAVLVELDKEQVQARLRKAEAGLLSAQARLAQIRRNLTPQQRASAESSVRQARIALEQAEERYQRIAELYGKGYATEEELDDARAARDAAEESLRSARERLELDLQGGEEEDIAVAEANVAISQAELDDAEEELANTTIRSPLSGRVLTRPVEVGTAVSSGTTGNTGGTVVATIGDMSTLYVEARIDETDLGRVTVGMPCRVTFDAYVGQVWGGLLSKIYPQGEQNQGGGTRFMVDVELEPESPRLEVSSVRGGERSGGGPPTGAPQGGSPRGGGANAGAGAGAGADAGPGAPPQAMPELKPSMTANVEFVLDDHPDVLILPARFVQYDEERNPYCELLLDPEDQERRERRDLQLGFSDGMRFEVIGGLVEGDTVILERPIIEENRPF